MTVTKWMSWEGGVDLVAVTQPGLTMPNVIVHVARMVHTPVGSAPAGVVLLQPDPQAAPRLFGFISSDVNVGRYFGPHIFAGTPFEQAPVLQARITVDSSRPDSPGARIEVAGMVIETRLSNLRAAELVHRAPAAMPPFAQQGVEAAAGSATLHVDGQALKIILPPVGITGGPAAAWSPCGVYAR